jgi:hypothetical protein
MRGLDRRPGSEDGLIEGSQAGDVDREHDKRAHRGTVAVPPLRAAGGTRVDRSTAAVPRVAVGHPGEPEVPETSGGRRSRLPGRASDPR